MTRSHERFGLVAVVALLATLAVTVLPASAAVSPWLVRDIAPGPFSSFAHEFTTLGDQMFFGADDNSGIGRELWVTDGTEEGTVLVENIDPSIGSTPSNLTVFDGAVYFAARSGFDDAWGLWKSDGTADGTVLVADPYPGPNDTLFGLTHVFGSLYFTVYNDPAYELWRTDGTTGGTTRVSAIGGGWLTELNGSLLLVAYTTDEGSELYTSDGTEEGTELLKDLTPGSSSPEYLTAIGDTVYFAAYTDESGRELWRTDGTAAGTTLVKDINPGVEHSSPTYLVNVGGTLFFWAGDSSGDVELWKSDGTETGTVRVEDINAAGSGVPFDYYPQRLVESGGRLFFHANGGTSTGVEVWTSDGTEAGTHIVEDIRPGGLSSAPRLLTDVDGRLFFMADDGTTGLEHWRANAEGTEAELIADLNPNGDAVFRETPASTYPWFGLLGGSVYFGADDGTNGWEMWRLPLVSLPDDVPPTIQVLSPADGASFVVGENVIANYRCSDAGGSGLESCAGDVADGAAIDTATPGTKSFTVTARDGAGNESTKSVTYEVVAPADVLPPEITLTSPTDGGSYRQNETVIASYSCHDPDSGLASCSGTVPDGSPIDTASPGEKSFVVTASDVAGNTASLTAIYTVTAGAFDFSGFFAPIDNAPVVNVMAAGKGVQIPFSLDGDRGLDILAAAPISTVEACRPPSAREDRVEATVRLSESKLTYRPRPDRYVFFWATQRSWRGQCRELVLELTDGSMHRILFRFA